MSAEKLQSIAAALANGTPKLIDDIAEIHDPILEIVQKLRSDDSKAGTGDNVAHANKKLGQLANATIRIASGNFKIDSRMGAGDFSDFITQPDKITDDLSTQLAQASDDDIPETLTAKGVTIQIIQDRISAVAQRINASGLKQAGLDALQETRQKQ